MALAALGCLLLTAVFVLATPRPVTPAAVIVDYHRDLVSFDRAAPDMVLAPQRLPSGWQPVSSRLTAAPGPTVSWHLGFITPSGQVAAVEQSDEPPAGFIRRMTNNGNQISSVWSGGAWWSRTWRPDKRQRAMYRPGPGTFTVVVTGTASWAELSVLAAALRPQP
jgi:hypothetical protein